MNSVRLNTDSCFYRATSAAINGADNLVEEHNIPAPRPKKVIRFASPESRELRNSSLGECGMGGSSPKFSPGEDLLDLKPGNRSYVSDDLSSVSSREETEFKQDLANLDANIARLQRNLQEALTRK